MYKREDTFYKRAKKEGYPSRAVYKLKELAKKYAIVGKGDRVLDLGCAPGGWSQVALEIVGSQGKVVGVDITEMKGFQRQNFRFVQGDIRDDMTLKRAMEALKGPCDAVLSDLSPHLTGIKPKDEAQAAELFATAWSCARKTLRPGGNILMKLFPGPEADSLAKEIRPTFREVTLTRPGATRKASSELYLIGKGFRG